MSYVLNAMLMLLFTINLVCLNATFYGLNQKN